MKDFEEDLSEFGTWGLTTAFAEDDKSRSDWFWQPPRCKFVYLSGSYTRQSRLPTKVQADEFGAAKCADAQNVARVSSVGTFKWHRARAMPFTLGGEQRLCRNLWRFFL